MQDLADHVSGQESEGHTRELFWECEAKSVNIIVRGVVIGGHVHKNIGIRCPNRRRITVRENDAAPEQTYVVNDVQNFAPRYLLATLLLDLTTIIAGYL